MERLFRSERLTWQAPFRPYRRIAAAELVMVGRTAKMAGSGLAMTENERPAPRTVGASQAVRTERVAGTVQAAARWPSSSVATIGA